MAVLLLVILTAAWYCGVEGFVHNDLYGISHITLVVRDMGVSRRFYTDVLGGMPVEDLNTGPEGVYGDSHFYRMFQKEILDAQKSGKSLQDVGVPDISDVGSYKVVWEFILLPNSLIQLMQFVHRSTGALFIRSDQRVGNAFVTSTHAAFMADDTVIPLQQIQDIIKKQDLIPGYPDNKKGFIAGMFVDSFEERRSQSLETYLLEFGGSAFRLANMRGPGGERLEVAYRRGEGLKPDLGLFCRSKAVFPLMLDIRVRNIYQSSPSTRMAGLSHTNAVVDDMEATKKFYINVLGGILNPLKTFSGVPVDEAMQVETFQEEILEAKELGLPADESFGILPARERASQSSYDFAFFLFDNFYFEPYRFYVNESYHAGLYRNWSSPAYTNNQHTSFWVKDTVNMASFIKTMESRSARLGLSRVKVNRAVPVAALGDAVSTQDYSRPFPEGHRLEGYDYTYFKGPSGEQLVLTQFLGKARATLKAAMEKYGALSTAFESTNPWTWDGFSKSCKWLTQ